MISSGQCIADVSLIVVTNVGYACFLFGAVLEHSLQLRL